MPKPPRMDDLPLPRIFPSNPFAEDRAVGKADARRPVVLIPYGRVPERLMPGPVDPWLQSNRGELTLFHIELREFAVKGPRQLEIVLEKVRLLQLRKFIDGCRRNQLRQLICLVVHEVLEVCKLPGSF